MKNKKIYITTILALVMFFSTIIPAKAYEINNYLNESTFTSEAFYYDSEREEVLDENGKPFSFEDVVIQIPNGDSRASYEVYLIRSGLLKSSKGVFTWWFNVDCPTSPFDKPYIKLSVQLKGNFTNGGTHSNVGSSVYHTYKTNSEYSVDYTWETPAKTGYYYFSYTLTDFDAGQTKYSSSESTLMNRTGHIWDFTFSDTGKSLPKPRADWKKGTIYDRPNNLADTYYKTYTTKTGKTLVRSLYDVHHIQPLSYGGSNSYSNLIHLPKDLHKKVTGWFNGY